MVSRIVSRLPIPHLFMGGSIALLMVSAMAGHAAEEAVDGTCTGEVTMEGVRVIDAQQPGSSPVEIPDRGVLRGRHTFGSWAIASWTGESSIPELVASQTYALPDFIPRGSGPVPEPWSDND